MLTTAFSTQFTQATPAVSSGFARRDAAQNPPLAFRLTGSTGSSDRFELTSLNEYQRGLNQQYLI